MTKGDKETLVAQLVNQLKSVKGAVITEYRGTSVGQMEQIRRQFHEAGIHYRVAKNSLLKRAVKEAGMHEPEGDILDRPIALAMSDADEVVVAKVVAQINKVFETIVPVGGIVQGRFVDQSVINQLATLPGRDELLGRLVGGLASLPTKLIRTINNPLQGLVTALSAIKTSKEA